MAEDSSAEYDSVAAPEHLEPEAATDAATDSVSEQSNETPAEEVDTTSTAAAEGESESSASGATGSSGGGSPSTPFSTAAKPMSATARPGATGAMAQLGLVPPGAAMSIIRTQQSNPSQQAGSSSPSENNSSLPNTSEKSTNNNDGQTANSTGTIGFSNAANTNSNVNTSTNAPANETQGLSTNSNGGTNLPPGLVYPALHLHPLNDTFAPKQISLAPPGPNNRIRIGRQTNTKTLPHPSNGYFDSKVLSRAHAEVWSQDGKVYIKDIKSSNGTFINGDRLSPEAQESEVYELHNEDLVEFGIDIVGDDNKTIIHHKVSCRVYLVITAEDALGMRNDFNSLYHGGHRAPIGLSGIGPGAEGGLRRGKPGGMSFDHILSKLQNELAKSRETNSELGGLAGTFSEIHHTLEGGLQPGSNPLYQHMVPPLVSESDAAASKEAAEDAKKQSATVAALQTSLVETQASLAAHVDKIRSLEGMLAEHEQIKAEVGLLKYQMEVAKQEVDAMVHSHQVKSPRSRAAEEDFDDGASVASVDTVTADNVGDFPPEVRKSVDEVHDPAVELKNVAVKKEEEDDHEGPRAPPDLPPGLRSKGNEIVDASSAEVAANLTAMTAQFEAKNSALVQRLEALEGQLETALSLGRDLQSQHATATETVKLLQERVQSLEAQVEEKVKQIESSASAMSAMEGRWAQWKEQIEEGWRQERKGWEQEREHIRSVVAAWDEANRKLEEEVANASSSSGSKGVSNVPNSPGGKRKGNKNAKRRQGKRHVNRDLRALLYKAEFNREAGGSLSTDDDTEDDDGDHKSTSTTDRSTSSAFSGGSGDKASTIATSPPLTASNASSGSEDGRIERRVHARKGNSRGDAPSTSVQGAHSQSGGLGLDGLPFRFKDNSATLPVLTACGVVLVGIAAWALAKKEKS